MRDEGVTSLSTFARLGGIVCFNKYSMNYDFFVRRYPEGTIAHHDLLDFAPSEIKSLRLKKKNFTHPPLVSYENLSSQLV